MRALLRKRRLLSEQDRVLYRGSFEDLRAEEVGKAVTELRLTSSYFDFVSRYVVPRSIELTPSWMMWFAHEQNKLYLEDTKELRHDLTLLLIQDRQQEQIDLIFRLSKSGYGNIQYRLTVQRTEPDLFLCYEG